MAKKGKKKDKDKTEEAADGEEKEEKKKKKKKKKDPYACLTPSRRGSKGSDEEIPFQRMSRRRSLF